MTIPTVLFLCVHNAGRSLAARVLLDHYADGRVTVESAGSEPAGQLNPSVVAVLVERGLDPTREFPKPPPAMRSWWIKCFAPSMTD